MVSEKASLEVRAAGRKAVNTLAGGSMSSNLVIIHFNDVYNVEPRAAPEPVGGAARFCTAVRSFQHLHPLILFSGDAFSPSMRKLMFFLEILNFNGSNASCCCTLQFWC